MKLPFNKVNKVQTYIKKGPQRVEKGPQRVERCAVACV